MNEMEHPSYNYTQRTGVQDVSWELFHGLCKGLAQAAAPFEPEIILAVGRGGFYPGTLVAHLLRTEIYPVQLSRRVNDVVRHKEPKWLTRPPRAVKGRRVLVVDEISSTGETLQMVKEQVSKLGAAKIQMAVLFAHSWSAEIPDYIGVISDALIVNPWDREILVADEFRPHPEYVQSLAPQGQDLSRLAAPRAVAPQKMVETQPQPPTPAKTTGKGSS